MTIRDAFAAQDLVERATAPPAEPEGETLIRISTRLRDPPGDARFKAELARGHSEQLAQREQVPAPAT